MIFIWNIYWDTFWYMKVVIDFINNIQIRGTQFAICHRVLMVSEWPFVLFSKIANDQNFIQIHLAVSAISSPSCFLLETFSWSSLSMKMYA